MEHNVFTFSDTLAIFTRESNWHPWGSAILNSYIQTQKKKNNENTLQIFNKYNLRWSVEDLTTTKNFLDLQLTNPNQE